MGARFARVQLSGRANPLTGLLSNNLAKIAG
jgi:hypothetical protein